tara:strand:- start:140 stop:328 length:189 start_codon:yes stop_codon:yes gene_type:complete
MNYSENYQVMNNRINEASTIAALRKLEKSLDRCAAVGCFVDGDIARLDSKLLAKLIKLEVKT